MMMKHTHFSKRSILMIIFLSMIQLLLHAQTDSVYYHTGKFKSQYGASGYSPQPDYYRFTTRITPPYYPAKLRGIKAWFRNADNPSSFKFLVYKDPAGSAMGPPGTTPDYLSPAAINNPASGGLADSAYSYYGNLLSQNIIISSGDVYCGVAQHPMTNGFVGIAIDTANNYTTDRPWVYYGVWSKMITYVLMDGEWGITAYFNPVPTSINQTENQDLTTFSIFPEPVKDQAIIAFQLKEPSSLSIELLNSLGSVVEVIMNNENLISGNHTKTVAFQNLAAGLYIVKMKVNHAVVSRKFVKT